MQMPRAATRLAGLALIALLIVPPGAAQKKPLRERGWTPRQTQDWIERMGSQPLGRRAALDECSGLVDFTNRRDAILNGNRITAQIQNFGSISSPGNSITDIVWNGLGYGYEFGPFVAAEVEVPSLSSHPDAEPKRDENGNPVTDENGNPIYVVKIVSDGLVSNGGETSPDGREVWGWQPIPCAQSVGTFEGMAVVNPSSDAIPTSNAPDENFDGKPDSWPDAWYNETLKEYVWPGALQQGASNADQEALYFMNDYANREFPYYPFPGDTLRRGLGLEIEVRTYQWANALSEDAIFLVYKITNKSDKDLEKVTFGMWGDPHIGGPSDYTDDLAYFDRSLNMVFAYDADGRSDIPGRSPGYFGYKFLESPGLGTEIINGVTYPGDGIDNDGDGMVDESWTDGLDNDGDWDPDADDVGIDGVPNTGDEGENDGVPTAGDPFDITKPGEPNFEFTDIDESDMIGLTSFASPGFAGTRISNDRQVWGLVEPGSFDNVPANPGDYVFIYGSGSFPLHAGETKRFSIALLMGENLEDLRLNAETVQQIFEVGYRFARPPDKPTLTAVPGDGKVTLYWNDVAERSVDPLSREQDFEGYAIYRSTDHEFSDQRTITDINGAAFLFRPLTNPVGVEAKFDLDNGLEGASPIPYKGHGVSYDLGDDTGLFHTYVDSNNVVNGQTYYYTVVAYDRGYLASDSAGASGIPPSETSKTITYLPTTDQYIFDVNTVAVTPRPRAAGYVPAQIDEETGLVHDAGTGTGTIGIEIEDEMAVRDAGRYSIDFDVVSGQTVYSVINEVPVTVRLPATTDRFRSLGYTNVQAASLTLAAGGRTLTAGTDYDLDADAGRVLVHGSSGVADGDTITATFTFAPLVASPYVAGEEANIVFDGLHLFVQDEDLEIDDEETGWAQGGSGLDEVLVRVATAGPGRVATPFDYEIQFANEPVSTGFGNGPPLPFRVFNLTKANEQIQVFAPDVNRNGAWDPAEQIIFLDSLDGRLSATWQVELVAPTRTPGAGDVFYVRTKKPFTASDRFTFQTVGVRTDAELARQELRDIYVVPNPYVATNEIEPRNPVSRSERGDRRLYFANVPPQCTIRIYTLSGELVDTIEHNSTADDGKAFWDLRSRDNMSIAYGLYLFHVESPEGTFTGKFAVIK